MVLGRYIQDKLWRGGSGVGGTEQMELLRADEVVRPTERGVEALSRLTAAYPVS